MSTTGSASGAPAAGAPLAAAATSRPDPHGDPPRVRQLLLRMGALAVIDAVALWLVYQMLADGVWFLALPIALVTIFLNAVFLRRNAYPLRWLSPGMALLILMFIYPLAFTVYTAFTNYGDGHLLTKQQTINLIEQSHVYLPDGADVFEWAAYRDGGRYLLWLRSDAGQTYLAAPGEPVRAVEPARYAPLDTDGMPQQVDGYQRLPRGETVRHLSTLDQISFGHAPQEVRIRSLDAAAFYQQRYEYDVQADAIVDRSTGVRYAAEEGRFVSADGVALRPGYQITVGWQNFERLVTNPALYGPFLKVFAWTFAFAILSVGTTFVLGLLLALIFNDRRLPFQRAIRTILIIPYAIPGFIAILIWVGLLNPHLGVVNSTLDSVLGWSPAWFSDPTWAKVGILLVNLWLGFPYMMLICTGALQAIPQEMYDAAHIDGANAWQRLRAVTLPLLLVIVGPLLIGAFAFNFNNFAVIYLYNGGGPPMAGTATPAGHTDILISYTFRLAFEGGRGADYGYAAAVTIAIFLIIALITVFNFRFMKQWEAVSRNV